jgi:hydrogenase-4 component A
MARFVHYSLAYIMILCIKGMVMNRFILAEPLKCNGCGTCMAACSSAHLEQGLLDRPRLVVMRDDDGTAPVACRHCEDMPCAKVCPVNAITLTAQSVRINENTCVGCKLCGLVCPFGAITPAAGKPVGHLDTYEHYGPNSVLADVPTSHASMNPFLTWNAGQRIVAVKCDLCYFRAAGPACVQICPTGALSLADEAAMEEIKKARRLSSLDWLAQANAASPEHKTNGGRG